MRRFVLVDLHDQAASLPRELLVSREGFLAWLRLFGEVGDWPRYDGSRRIGDAFAIRALSGLETSFSFDDTGRLHVGRDLDVIRRVFRRDGMLIKSGYM